MDLFTVKNFVIYLLGINIIAFLAMLIDKKKAEHGSWRISEKALIMFAVFGGSIGSLIGMYTFRHKTKKLKFTVVIPSILILQIFLIICAIRNGII